MTMKEIAQLAGVSTSAVSRYINGGSLSKEKRERIRDAIETTGYHPDAAAQMLRTGATTYVGLIVPKLESTAMTRFVSGATAALSEAGYMALLAESGGDTETEINYLSLFQNRQVAGIIFLASALTPKLEDELRDITVPLVVAGQRFRQIPCIYHDDFGAAYELASLVLEKGRTKLAYLGVSEQDVAVGLNRKKGVQQAMKEYGVNPDTLQHKIVAFSLEGGRSGMNQLLAEGNEFDAVICATDRIAFGAMEVLKKAGKKLPEEVSVVGMDDYWAGEQIEPHLTTAHFYYKTCGDKAAKLLTEMISNKGKAGPIHQIMLGYSVVERDSI